MVRTALYEAANILLSRVTRFSTLKRWGMDVAKRRGTKRAKVALARKIGVILHRMWVDSTNFRLDEGGAKRSAAYPSLKPDEFQSEPDQARLVRSPLAGTMEPVKPQD